MVSLTHSNSHRLGASVWRGAAAARITLVVILVGVAALPWLLLLRTRGAWPAGWSVWAAGAGVLVGATVGALLGGRFAAAPIRLAWWARVGGALIASVLSLLGAFMLLQPRMMLAGALLCWLGPVLAVAWLVAGDVLVARGAARWMVSAGALGSVFLTGSVMSVAPVAAGIAAMFLAQEFGSALASPHVVDRIRGHTVPAWSVLLALAVVLKIPVPLLPDRFLLLATLSTGCLALSALHWLWSRMGPRALAVALLTFMSGLVVEVIGSRTGIPFGHYEYATLGPQVLGVPLLVPLGWWGMTLAAWVLSRGNAAGTALRLVAWDVGLEALMTAQGVWTWRDDGVWYGAPVSNFAGWMVMGALLAWALRRTCPPVEEGRFAWAYRLEALFLPAGLWMLGMVPAALASGLLMNLLAWPLGTRAFGPALHPGERTCVRW